MNTVETHPELRFGLMCSGNTLRAWQARVVQELQQSGLAKLVVLIQPANESPQKAKRSKHTVFKISKRLMKKPTAHQTVDMTEAYDGVEILDCVTHKKGRFSIYFSQSDIEMIRDQNLDFILRFSFGIIRGDILKAARYGVWSFHHGDERAYRGRPPGFWEIYSKDPKVGVTLQRLTDRLDGGIILNRGITKTVPYSYSGTLDRIYWSCTSWPVAVCRDILNGVDDYLSASPSKTEAPIYTFPDNNKVLAFLGRCSYAWFYDRFERAFVSQDWSLGLIDTSIHRLLSGDKKPSVSWLPLSDDTRFVADGFVVPISNGENEKIYFLAEVYYYEKRSGRIECFAVDLSNGSPRIEELGPVFDDGTHMSYPYIFEDAGKVYCVPETCQSRMVRLYEMVGEPHRWEMRQVLLDDVQYLDCSIVKYNDLYWLFGTKARQAGTNHGHLHIWWAEDLMGPWKPHLSNPVKEDVGSSRPAGTICEHDGKLIRPAQDCSETYGGEIVLNRIEELSPKTFVEVEVSRLKPDKAGDMPDGMHTISSYGAFSLIDGKRHRLIGKVIREKVKRKLRL